MSTIQPVNHQEPMLLTTDAVVPAPAQSQPVSSSQAIVREDSYETQERVSVTPSSAKPIPTLFSYGATTDPKVAWSRTGDVIDCTVTLLSKPIDWETFQAAALDVAAQVEYLDQLQVESITEPSASSVAFTHGLKVYLGFVPLGKLNDQVRLDLINEGEVFKAEMAVTQPGDSVLGSLQHAVCTLDQNGVMTVSFQIQLGSLAASIPGEKVPKVLNQNAKQYALGLRDYLESL